MANARSVGPMLSNLRAQEDVKIASNIRNGSASVKTSNLHNREKAKYFMKREYKPTLNKNYRVQKQEMMISESHSAATGKKVAEQRFAFDTKVKRNSDADPSRTHPKAVGDLLKLLQSNKEKFYEKPSGKKSELKIFTPYYGPKVVLEEHDDCDVILPKRRKKKVPDENDFYCDLCKVSCTSQVVLDSHLIGKKHMKNVTKLQANALAFKRIMTQQEKPSFNAALIEAAFNNLAEIEPLVGLEYVTEYQIAGDTEHAYFCELCEFRASMTEMLDHIIMRQHRLRFMRTHFFDIYYKITGYPSFKNIMRTSQADKLLRQHSAFVVRTVLKGNLPHSNVKPYYDEESIQIDLRRHQGPGGIHPSQHKDLQKAEFLLKQGEATEQREKEEMEEKRKETEQKQIIQQQREEELQNKIERVKAERIKSRMTRQLAQLRKPSTKESELYIEVDPETNHSHDLTQDYSSVVSRQQATFLSQNIQLNEQELRIRHALRKLEESSHGDELNASELNAHNKLRRLLTEIQDRKQANISKIRSVQPGPELNLNKRPQVTRHDTETFEYQQRSVPPQGHHSVGKNKMDQHLDGYGLKKSHQSLSMQNVSTHNHQSNIDLSSLIEKTRWEVEQKILRALTSGPLAPLAEEFKKNPKLQASLQQWEKSQTTRHRSDDVHSQERLRNRTDGIDIGSRIHKIQGYNLDLNAQDSSERLPQVHHSHERLCNHTDGIEIGSLIHKSHGSSLDCNTRDSSERLPQFHHSYSVWQKDGNKLKRRYEKDYIDKKSVGFDEQHMSLDNNFDSISGCSGNYRRSERDTPGSSSGGKFVDEYSEDMEYTYSGKSRSGRRNDLAPPLQLNTMHHKDNAVIDYSDDSLTVYSDSKQYPHHEAVSQNYGRGSSSRHYRKERKSKGVIGSRPQFARRHDPKTGLLGNKPSTSSKDSSYY